VFILCADVQLMAFHYSFGGVGELINLGKYFYDEKVKEAMKAVLMNCFWPAIIQRTCGIMFRR
jgi:hypothetical protein